MKVPFRWTKAPPTQVMMRPFQQLHNRYPMTFLANARRRFQRFSPYLSLLVLLVPLLLVEPLKIAALFVAGKGHWITGTGILVGAYIVSLFFVERLFKVVKPKLLMLPWFAQLWRWYETARDKTITVVTGNHAKARAGHTLRNQIFAPQRLYLGGSSLGTCGYRLAGA